MAARAGGKQRVQDRLYLLLQRKLTTNFAIGELFCMGVEVVDARHKFGDLRIGIRGRPFYRFTRGVDNRSCGFGCGWGPWICAAVMSPLNPSWV